MFLVEVIGYVGEIVGVEESGGVTLRASSICESSEEISR
jgi:hypothetical protein